MQYNEKSERAVWADFQENSQNDLGIALANLYSELKVLDSDGAFQAGFAGVERLLLQDDFNRASQLTRTVCVDLLDREMSDEALEILKLLDNHLIWLDNFENGMVEYSKAQVMLSQGKFLEAKHFLELSQANLIDYTKTRGQVILELARVLLRINLPQDSLKTSIEAIESLKALARWRWLDMGSAGRARLCDDWDTSTWQERF